jgi:twitching motility protein PilI
VDAIMSESNLEPKSESKGLSFSPSARRARLRDFQTQLMERMQAAKSGALVGASQLGVRIGGERFLIDLREAGEIVTFANLTQVPLTKEWYLGLSNIRGNLTSVVDYSRFAGGSTTPQESSCRVLAFANSLVFNSGLLVSQVLGLRNVDEMNLLDDAQQDAHSPWVLNRYQDRDGQEWKQLSIATLVQNQDFLQIGL